VSCKVRSKRAFFRVPEFRRGIPAGSRDGGIIRREDSLVDRILMSGQYGENFPVMRIPDNRRAVLAGRHDPLPIVRIGGAVDGRLVPDQFLEQVS